MLLRHTISIPRYLCVRAQTERNRHNMRGKIHFDVQTQNRGCLITNIPRLQYSNNTDIVILARSQSRVFLVHVTIPHNEGHVRTETKKCSICSIASISIWPMRSPACRAWPPLKESQLSLPQMA